MLNERKQKALEEFLAEQTTGAETIEELKQILRIMGIKFNQPTEENYGRT